MPIDKVKKSSALIERVEQFLQAGLESNKKFNQALDRLAPIEVMGLNTTEPYLFNASEILYWADRNAYLDEFENWIGEQKKGKYTEVIQYIYSSNQDAVFSDLINLLRRKRIAPFVGAGISAAAGFPGWGKALEQLADRLPNINKSKVDALLTKYEYLELAQLLSDESPSQLENHVKTIFRAKADIERDESRVPPVIKLLPRLCSGAMVTTNFDTLIEDWFKGDGRPSFDGFLNGLQEDSNFVQKLLKGDTCLLKLHGDASQASTHVFTKEQYNKAYGDNDINFCLNLPKSLRQIYVSHSLLFLGCSLGPDKTMELFKQVRDENQFVIPEHFAFLAEPLLPSEEGHESQTVNMQEKQSIEDRLFDLGIRPIWYEGNNHHSMLPKLLSLAVDVADNRVELRL